ncbi:hypothetical protein Golob_007012 [Gossypium lobatum]|uniref:DUF4283 domain-containing protein n=1 Tax=Gossypium lobatum TaxID=34289 RepID=A0A7J8NCS3_9ROSI|nr:hypothetical protein [Gossypium lobatum]
MESALADLRLEDEEETGETVAREMAQESEVHDKQSYFQSMRSVMANLWRPIGGVMITNIVKIKPNEEPLEVPLLSTALWVQIHNLSLGIHSESLARQFGSFIGTFLEYDANAIVAGF